MVRIAALIALCLVAGLSFVAPAAAEGPIERRALMVDGVERVYFVKRPRRAQGRLPLYLILHGGGGDAGRLIERQDARDRIVIAPQAIERSWAVEGLPTFRGTRPSADDAKFVGGVIEAAIARDGADPRRIQLGGISRGGMLIFHLLERLERPIDKAAILIASMPAHLRPGYRLRHATDILILNGTEDLLVPYAGGWGPLRGDRRVGDPKGRMLPTEAVARDLAGMMGLGPRPRIERLADRADDGCRVERWRWAGRSARGSVTLLKVIGGGHTIPGTPPAWGWRARLVGPTCQDIDGFLAVERFLRAP